MRKSAVYVFEYNTFHTSSNSYMEFCKFIEAKNLREAKKEFLKQTGVNPKKLSVIKLSRRTTRTFILKRGSVENNS